MYSPRNNPFNSYELPQNMKASENMNKVTPPSVSSPRNNT